MNDLLREIFSCGRFFVGMFLLDCLKNMVYCIEHDVMKDFLQEHEREVVDMVGFEWDEKNCPWR